MAFDTSLPGISEACADALQAWMIARLSMLNAMLARSGSALPVRTVTAAQILLGDGQVMPATFDVWFAIQSGDRDSGQEFSINYELFGESDGLAFKNDYSAVITAYIHPNVTWSNDPIADIAMRHRVLSRLQDWLRVVCFNNANATLIPLASREYNVSPNFDSLKAVIADRFYRGAKPKGYGKLEWAPAVECALSGVVF